MINSQRAGSPDLSATQGMVSRGEIERDPHQIAALERLDKLYHEIVASSYEPNRIDASVRD